MEKSKFYIVSNLKYAIGCDDDQNLFLFDGSKNNFLPLDHYTYSQIRDSNSELVEYYGDLAGLADAVSLEFQKQEALLMALELMDKSISLEEKFDVANILENEILKNFDIYSFLENRIVNTILSPDFEYIQLIDNVQFDLFYVSFLLEKISSRNSKFCKFITCFRLFIPLDDEEWVLVNKEFTDKFIFNLFTIALDNNSKTEYDSASDIALNLFKQLKINVDENIFSEIRKSLQKNYEQKFVISNYDRYQTDQYSLKGNVRFWVSIEKPLNDLTLFNIFDSINFLKKRERFKEITLLLNDDLLKNYCHEILYCERAIAHYYLQERIKSSKYLDIGLTLNSNFLKLYHLRGTIYYIRNDWISAIADFTKIISKDQNYYSAYCNRGAVYNALKKPRKAIQNLSAALELCPFDFNSYLNRGNAYFYWGKYELAINDYTRCIAINNQDFKIFYYRALALNNLGNQEKAIEDYTDAINLNPSYLTLYEQRTDAILKNNELNPSFMKEIKSWLYLLENVSYEECAFLIFEYIYKMYIRESYVLNNDDFESITRIGNKLDQIKELAEEYRGNYHSYFPAYA